MIVGVTPSCLPKVKTSAGDWEDTKRPAGTDEAPLLAEKSGSVDPIIVPKVANATTKMRAAIRTRPLHRGVLKTDERLTSRLTPSLRRMSWSAVGALQRAIRARPR